MIHVLAGRSASGKTGRMLSMLSNAPPGAKAIVITPANDTFEAEKKVLGACPEKAVFDVSVTSLPRLMRRAAEATGLAGVRTMSEAGRGMLLRDVLIEIAPELPMLGRLASESAGFADKMLDAVSELRRSRISPEDLCAMAPDITPASSSARLLEMARVYVAYMERLTPHATDEEDFAGLVAERLEAYGEIKGAALYFDGFDSFTASDMRFISALVSQAGDAVFTLTWDGEDPAFVTGETLEFIKSLGECELEAINPDRETEGDPFAFLEARFLSQGKAGAFARPVSEIQTALAQSPEEESDWCASKVASLVRAGYRYGEITIATPPDTYPDLLASRLADCQVPFYVEGRWPILYTSPVRALLFLTGAAAQNPSIDDLVAYAKTGFAGVSDSAIYDLENYLTEFPESSIPLVLTRNGRKYPWDLSALNATLATLSSQMAAVRAALRECDPAPASMAASLYEWLTQAGFEERILSLRSQYSARGMFEEANVAAQIYNQLLAVLDEISTHFENPMTPARFHTLITFGLAHSGVGLIPSVLDKVRITTLSGAASGDAKALLVLGAVSGSFPPVPDGGLLDDEVAFAAFKRGAMLRTSGDYLRRKSVFGLYKTLAKDRQYLGISASRTDEAGAACAVSPWFEKIAALFPVQEADRLPSYSRTAAALAAAKDPERLSGLIDYLSDDPQGAGIVDAVMSSRVYARDEGLKDLSVWKKTLGDPFLTSVSMLEAYATCPYAFFVDYALRPKTPRKAEFLNVDAGSALHAIVDRFSKDLLEGKVSIQDLGREECEMRVSSIATSVLSSWRDGILGGLAESAFFTGKLTRAAFVASWEMVCQLRASDFRLASSETRFGPGSDLSPMVIETESGIALLEGVADRVDVFETYRNVDGNEGGEAEEAEKYFRIIDYKSSEKRYDADRVAAGLDIQLPLYLAALASAWDGKGAGIFYAKLLNSPVDLKKELDIAEIEELARKQSRLAGVALRDIRLIAAMGPDSMTGFAIKGDGISSKNALEAEKFEAISQTAYEVAGQLAEGIINAAIAPSPVYYRGTLACSRCSAKPACGFALSRDRDRIRRVGAASPDSDESGDYDPSELASEGQA